VIKAKKLEDRIIDYIEKDVKGIGTTKVVCTCKKEKKAGEEEDKGTSYDVGSPKD